MYDINMIYFFETGLKPDIDKFSHGFAKCSICERERTLRGEESIIRRRF